MGDEDGADVAGLHLVLVPESVPANSPFYREAWTETDGSVRVEFDKKRDYSMVDDDLLKRLRVWREEVGARYPTHK